MCYLQLKVPVCSHLWLLGSSDRHQCSQSREKLRESMLISTAAIIKKNNHDKPHTERSHYHLKQTGRVKFRIDAASLQSRLSLLHICPVAEYVTRSRSCSVIREHRLAAQSKQYAKPLLPIVEGITFALLLGDVVEALMLTQPSPSVTQVRAEAYLIGRGEWCNRLYLKVMWILLGIYSWYLPYSRVEVIHNHSRLFYVTLFWHYYKKSSEL